MRLSAAFFRPARRPALAGLIGTLAMIAVPASALAQSCKTIPREIAVLQSEFDLMAESSPGITTAYRLCSNDGKFPRGAEDYTACMIVFCTPADSYIECIDISHRLAIKKSSISRLETYFDENCS